MASIEDTLAKMRSQAGAVHFAAACKVVTSYFGEPRQNGTSHKFWKMPWAGDPRINMQKGKGGLAKAYQVRQAVQAIDKLVAQQQTKPKHVKARTPIAEKPVPKKRRS